MRAAADVNETVRDATRTALVIDDDAWTRELLAALLESRGFAVEMLTGGAPAAQRTQDYDVIVLDANIPLFDDAPEVLQRVIALSGYSHTGGSQPSAFGTVSKPLDHREFMRLAEDCASQ